MLSYVICFPFCYGCVDCSWYTKIHSLPPAYIDTFNNEYYALLITQNRKALKTSKFLGSFSFFESLLDFLNDALIGIKTTKWIPKTCKGSTINKVEKKEQCNKSKGVCDVNCFI